MGATVTFDRPIQLCQGMPARPAVQGPHLHWNGGWYQYCFEEGRCPFLSCHPAMPEDKADTNARLAAEADVPDFEEWLSARPREAK